MNEFVMENEIENIVDKTTKKYLDEVISSYNNGNYRAAVTVLWTAVVYDLLRKMIILDEIYKDSEAKKILQKIESTRKKDPNNSSWERDLVKNISQNTKIITNVEMYELDYLKQQRNFAAHPIIQSSLSWDIELKKITKETAKDLIRKSFEIVFLRDPLLAKNIELEIFKDVVEYYKRVKDNGLEDHLRDVYFSRMTPERKDSLFGFLWKALFIWNDQENKENREPIFLSLCYLYNEDRRHYENLIKLDENQFLNKLQGETLDSWTRDNNYTDKGSKIQEFNRTSRIKYLIKFVEMNPPIYNVFNDSAKRTLKTSVNNLYLDSEQFAKSNYYDDTLYAHQFKTMASALFLYEDDETYIKTLNSVGKGLLEKNDIDLIFCQIEYKGWEDSFISFLINNYCIKGSSFREASVKWNILLPYLKYLKEEQYHHILKLIEQNNQYHCNSDISHILKTLSFEYKNKFNKEFIKNDELEVLYPQIFKNNQHYASYMDK